jgi:hypothetical protein
MTHEPPNGIRSAEVSRSRESKGTPEGSVMSSVLRDEFTAKRYSPWVSLVTGLVVTTLAVGVSSLLELQTHLPAVLLSIVCGLLLYDLVRTVVVRSGWPPSRTRARRLLPQAIRLRSRPVESSDPSCPRPRP